MKLTTRGRYAVTAMLDLALRDGQGPMSLADISKRQDISLSYLEQLFAKLRKSGLVKSTRGPGGGYSIARNLDDVSVSEIVHAVNESVDATNCGGKGGCRGDSGHCLTHNLWVGLSKQIDEFLSAITLEQLIHQKLDHHEHSSKFHENSHVGINKQEIRQLASGRS